MDNKVTCEKCGGNKWFLVKVLGVKGVKVRTICCTCDALKKKEELVE